jgi:hypothetical protein
MNGYAPGEPPGLLIAELAMVKSALPSVVKHSDALELYSLFCTVYSSSATRVAHELHRVIGAAASSGVAAHALLGKKVFAATEIAAVRAAAAVIPRVARRRYRLAAAALDRRRCRLARTTGVPFLPIDARSGTLGTDSLCERSAVARVYCGFYGTERPS